MDESDLLRAAAERGIAYRARLRDAKVTFFGFVIGGAVPAAVGADWLVTAVPSIRSASSPRSRMRGAWLHVDGAIGLWAAASRSWPGLAGLEQADSWSTDAHKWLNVPYDCGIVICRHQQSHRAAMTATASYLVQAAPGTDRDQVWCVSSLRPVATTITTRVRAP